MHKDKLAIVHQTGELDFEKVKAAYAQSSLRAEVKPFLERIVDEFAKADLVISRAGATTVAELAAAGRPAVMVPLPWAADDHQRKNAEAVERAGAGRMILQSELNGERLANELLALINAPQTLAAMSAASKTLAHPDAAARVVDIAEKIMEI
jgi:UDP-N-acetylglucosamine--N-acetylmuramyl-(pentapeptide) pyrophosphoryl-undecaprenol N-acetylglucosamine transferase